MAQVLGFIDVPTREEFAGLLALVQLTTARINQLENRMQITDQQAADLTREIGETKDALSALAGAFVGVRDALVAAQAELARLNQPAPAVDAAIATLNDEQAKVAALLAGSGGAGPVVA